MAQSTTLSTVRHLRRIDLSLFQQLSDCAALVGSVHIVTKVKKEMKNKVSSANKPYFQIFILSNYDRLQLCAKPYYLIFSILISILLKGELPNHDLVSG